MVILSVKGWSDRIVKWKVSFCISRIGVDKLLNVCYITEQCPCTARGFVSMSLKIPVCSAMSGNRKMPDPAGKVDKEFC